MSRPVRFGALLRQADNRWERIAESVKAIVGERLRPVYELIEVEEDEPAAADTAGMGEEEIIELIKRKFDASEVADDGEPEARSGAG